MTNTTDPLTAARAEALFTSDLSADSQPTAVEIAAAISQAVRRHGGSRGCAAQVAYAYGDRPETAAPRMRWARQTVAAAYPARNHPRPQPTGQLRLTPTTATSPNTTHHRPRPEGVPSPRRSSMRKLLTLAVLAALAAPLAACGEHTAEADKPISAPAVTTLPAIGKQQAERDIERRYQLSHPELVAPKPPAPPATSKHQAERDIEQSN